MMKNWGGRTPPAWIREIAEERPRPLVALTPPDLKSPQAGDIVLKPFIDGKSYQQLFRLETWDTHGLLDGPFDDIKRALESALEFGVTSRLVVWLDYSDDPHSHDLDAVPLYYSDTTAADTKSVA
jgi:hypothetical protein